MLADPFTHSPGFGGLGVVVAAIIAAGGVAVTITQRGREARRSEWWQRFTWLIDHTAELSVPLLFTLLDQLSISAKRLHDVDLIAFAQEYTADAYNDLLGQPDSPTPANDAHNDTDHDGGHP